MKRREVFALVYYTSVVVLLFFVGWFFRASYPTASAAVGAVAIMTALQGIRVGKQFRLQRYAEEVRRRMQTPPN